MKSCDEEHPVGVICQSCGHVEELSYAEGGADVPWWLAIVVGAGVLVVFLLVVYLILSLPGSVD
jgi:hypothetical protein